MYANLSDSKDFFGKSFVSVDQLDIRAIKAILDRARAIRLEPNTYSSLLSGKLLYSLFFNESTRTRFSTETAWIRLGGRIIYVNGTSSTSIQKGETWDHTLQMLAGYEPECIAIRCTQELLPLKASQKFTDISWVNCGDGSNEHPTQAMLDLLTISDEIPDLSSLKIAFVGDIKHGRTIKSLAKSLHKFGSEMYFLAPDSLHNKEEYESLGIPYQSFSIDDLEKVISKVDIVYATRPQLERMSQHDKFKYSSGVYQLKSSDFDGVKAKLMHPLPIDSSKLPEIHPEMDAHPNSLYFTQAKNGLWARMAIFSLLQGEK